MRWRARRDRAVLFIHHVGTTECSRNTRHRNNRATARRAAPASCRAAARAPCRAGHVGQGDAQEGAQAAGRDAAAAGRRGRLRRALGLRQLGRARDLRPVRRRHGRGEFDSTFSLSTRTSRRRGIVRAWRARPADLAPSAQPRATLYFHSRHGRAGEGGSRGRGGHNRRISPLRHSREQVCTFTLDTGRAGESRWHD